MPVGLINCRAVLYIATNVRGAQVGKFKNTFVPAIKVRALCPCRQKAQRSASKAAENALQRVTSANRNMAVQLA